MAVVGAGPAGMACATTAAERGHQVTLFDAADRIGGQFNIAKQIPGKEDFNETLRYFGRRIQTSGVNLQLNRRVDAAALKAGGFDHVVLATGIVPRQPPIPGIDSSKVASYLDIIEGRKSAGKTVAIIGAGGIGFDVGEFLTHAHDDRSEAERFNDEWGIDTEYGNRGGLKAPVDETAPRQVYLLQRKVVQGRRRAGQDHRLDPPHPAQEARGADDRRRELRAHRRRGAAHHRQWRSEDLAGRYHRHLRRAGAAPRTAGAAGRQRASRSR